MKAFAVVVAMACVVELTQSLSITPEMMDKFATMAQDCQRKTGATLWDLANLVQRNPLSTKSGKCLMSCMMQKVYTVDGNGKLVKEGAMLIAYSLTNGDPTEMKIAEEIIDDCVELDVSDDR